MAERSYTKGMLSLMFFMNIASAHVTKHETDIFGRFLAWQQVYKDRSIVELRNHLDDNFLHNFKQQYLKNIIQLKPLVPFLTTFTGGQIQEEGAVLRSPMNQGLQHNLSFLYEHVEHDVKGLINELVRSGFCTEKANTEEQANHFDLTVEKYKALIRLLFVQSDSFLENEYQLALANRLLEYCFSDTTFQHYKTLLTNYEYYPLARFVNTAVWYILVGEGWKHWHANTLDVLKKSYDQGKEIVYIAGGTDFYHLLRQGIYNIRIIDPFLPTQVRYYSEGWNYLINDDSVDNEIRFGPACKSIKMKCVSNVAGEAFSVKLSTGNVISIKKAVITWNIYDSDNKHIGQVVIERRPATQSDFDTPENKSLIMSYDEMLFIAEPDILNGWGIDPKLLSDGFNMNVKQLRNPITKNMLCNIRIASLLNFSDFKFINLASDPT